MTGSGQQECPTCGRGLPGDEFYANCAECKTCKRNRSQRNRALQARKIAAFERFVDVLFVLADRSAERDHMAATEAVS